MTIYALFLCFQALGTCQMQGASFSALSACHDYAKRVSGAITPPTNGRYPSANGMWFECRGKHLETWQPAQ